MEHIWESGLERNSGRGVMSCQVGVGYGWGYEYAVFKRPPAPAPALLVSRVRVNALRPRLALMPWLALIVSCALRVHASIDLR